MAVVMLEGFDHYDTAALVVLKQGWLSTNGSTGGGAGSNGTTTGRLSGRAFRLDTLLPTTGNTNTQSLVRPLPSTYTTLICGWAFRWSGNATQNQNVFQFRTAAGATVASIAFNSSTNVFTVSNAAGSVVATAVSALPANTWAYLELKVVVSGASGVATLRINGIIDTGVNAVTGNFGSTAIGQAAFLAINNSPNGLTSYLNDVDDVYVVDTTGAAPRNDFLGDSRVETLYPVADGAHTDWAPNSGTAHWSRVNEAPPDGDTSYVSDSTPGHRDTYQCSSLSTLVGAVYAVQTNLYARKDDAAARQIAPVIRKAGTDYDGTSTAGLSTSYLFYSQLYNQDPTSADWTIASVNAAEYGIKEVT